MYFLFSERERERKSAYLASFAKNSLYPNVASEKKKQFFSFPSEEPETKNTYSARFSEYTLFSSGEQLSFAAGKNNNPAAKYDVEEKLKIMYNLEPADR